MVQAEPKPADPKPEPASGTVTKPAEPKPKPASGTVTEPASGSAVTITSGSAASG